MTFTLVIFMFWGVPSVVDGYVSYDACNKAGKAAMEQSSLYTSYDCRKEK